MGVTSGDRGQSVPAGVLLGMHMHASGLPQLKPDWAKLLTLVLPHRAVLNAGGGGPRSEAEKKAAKTAAKTEAVPAERAQLEELDSHRAGGEGRRGCDGRCLKSRSC